MLASIAMQNLLKRAFVPSFGLGGGGLTISSEIHCAPLLLNNSNNTTTTHHQQRRAVREGAGHEMLRWQRKGRPCQRLRVQPVLAVDVQPK